MTEKLRDILQEEAGSARVPPTDLGPVLGAGGRAVRRRRLGGAGAVAAVAALAVAVTPIVVDRMGGGADVAGDPSAWTGVWADAESVHFGDVEVPRPKHLYELEASEDGALLIDWKETTTHIYGGRSPDSVPTPKSAVYWLDSEGHVEQIGQGAFGQAAVDGSIAAWFEDPDGKNVIPPQQETHTLVVYDTVRMREIARLPGVAAPTHIGAPAAFHISGSTVYYQISRQRDNVYWRWDWESGSAPERVDGGPITEADGLSTRRRLSPDGEFVLTPDDGGWAVARTDGSERTPLQLDGWHVPPIAGWDVSGNVTVLVARPDDPALKPVEDYVSIAGADLSIASCSPVDGSCEIVVESAGRGSELFLGNAAWYAESD